MSAPDASDHPRAVLFDRDDTLIVDVPYSGDPRRVRLMPGAREAVRLLRARRIPVGVVSNQSGIGRGLLTEAAVLEVNARVDALLGTPLDVWLHCPHLPEDGCGCRKPAPGLILEAAWRLGVDPSGAPSSATSARTWTRPAQRAPAGPRADDAHPARRGGGRARRVPRPARSRPAPAGAPVDGAEAAVRALVVRQDSFGDVLLAGPAVRAVAHRADRVTLLCGPLGAPAARMLPGVDEVLVWEAPWAGFSPPPVDRADVERTVDRLAAARIDAALVLTSFHQSPLPAALLLRLAGVPYIAATASTRPAPCWTCATGGPRTRTRRRPRRTWRRRRASRRPPATTGGCGCATSRTAPAG